MIEEHLLQIWCLHLSYKESYYQKTASMSFLEIYDVLQYIQLYWGVYMVQTQTADAACQHLTINQSGEGAIAMDTDGTVTELKNHLSAI